jgi:hypothetical protein
MGKQARSSFSEEKEAKRLLSVCGGNTQPRAKRTKVFWFFFSKKNSSFR